MKNNLTTIYVVRHGETEWNVIKKVQGQSDIPLNKNGINQAKELAQELQDVHFDHIFSSDLLRAKRTAEIIALERKLAVKTTEALRERSFGRYEGMNAKKFFALYNQWDKLSEEQQWVHKFGDEESNEEANIRFLTFIREAAVAYQGKNLLFVCHGALMRGLLVKLGYLQWSTYAKLINCGYIVLESDGVDFFLKKTSGLKLAKI